MSGIDGNYSARNGLQNIGNLPKVAKAEHCEEISATQAGMTAKVRNLGVNSGNISANEIWGFYPAQKTGDIYHCNPEDSKLLVDNTTDGNKNTTGEYMKLGMTHNTLTGLNNTVTDIGNLGAAENAMDTFKSMDAILEKHHAVA